MKNKKRIIILSAIALITLALLIVGVTYAYFQNQYGSASNADVNVTTYTTDVLTFSTGDAINLEADQTTFGKDKGSVSGTTYASALLTANNKTNKAVEHYYLYLNIENNTFTYSVQDNKPELIMTITDKDGNEVKNIEGLTYTEVTDRTNKKISGYDITTKNGLVTIFNNREIIAEPKAEDKWNITITFVNYEADQNANAGKVLSAKLMIQKESLSVANICKNGQSLSSCIVAMNGVDDNLYHHDASLVGGAGDNSYRYAGEDTAHPDYFSCKYNGTDVSNVDGELNKSLKGDCDSVSMVYTDEYEYVDKSINKIFTDKTTIKWDNANNKCVTTSGEDVLNISNEEALPQSLCNGYAYKIDGEEGWFGGIKIEELGSGVETLVEPAYDGVKNFVCFGSNESPCPTDNLYRIIGVFDHKISEKQTEKRVKLIKSDYANSNLLGTDGDYSTNTYSKSDYPEYKGELTTLNMYYWNYKNNTTINSGNGSNTWSTSLLNKTNLNKNFITNIGADWAAKIAETTWKVGGNSYGNIAAKPAKTAYQNEIVNPVTKYSTDNKTEYSAKIGLMYASDYGFAAAPSAWTANLETYDGEAIKNVNWMYLGAYEWTITRGAGADYDVSVTYDVFLVSKTGEVVYGYANYDLALRPVFSLKSSVNYVSGSGTATDPISIN